MGNTESNVASGVKKQVDTSSLQIYNLVDLKGTSRILFYNHRVVGPVESCFSRYNFDDDFEPCKWRDVSE